MSLCVLDKREAKQNYFTLTLAHSVPFVLLLNPWAMGNRLASCSSLANCVSPCSDPSSTLDESWCGPPSATPLGLEDNFNLPFNLLQYSPNQTKALDRVSQQARKSSTNTTQSGNKK